jgi:hypothetical protein
MTPTPPGRHPVTERHDRPHLEAVPPPEDDGGPTHTQRTPRDLAERAVLGAMLRDPAACAAATTTLQGSDFHHTRYEQVYDAIVHLYSRTQPVDTITVAHQLGNTLPKIGGQAELEQLHYEGLAVIDPGYYVDLVAGHAYTARVDQARARLAQLVEQHGDADPDQLAAAVEETYAQLRDHQVPGVDTPKPVNSWAPVDLAAVLTGDLSTPKATRMRRRDGKCLLYPYAVHSVSGEPGSGKTWAAMVAVAQALDQDEDAIILDFEDRAQTIVARLRALGVSDQKMIDHLHYIRPETALDPASRTQLTTLAATCTVAIVDGITEAMTMHGLSLMDNEDVARWLALVPNLVANQGPAVLQVDHVVKNAEARGRYAIGGQHKLAGITGTAFKMLTVKSFGKGTKGHAKLVIDKDKHGDVGPIGITIADLHMDATADDGSIYAWLDAPETSTDEDGEFQPTTLMERVSTFLLGRPGSSTLAEICAGVKGKDASIVDAVYALAKRDHVRIDPGSRNSKNVTLLDAYPRAD